MKNEVIKILQSIILDGLERFGKYYSSYRAFVYSNEDPLHCNRLKLIIPHIGGNEVYDYWCLPSNNFSGKGYGIQILPREKDLVWVEFEMGNPKKPIWKFGYFGENEKPQELTNYNSYWFKTPEGNLIELDDTNKLIRLTSAQGKIFEISDKISIGKKTKSDEAALLGDKTHDLLNKILTKLVNAKVNTAYGPQPLMNAPEFQILIEKELKEIRSKSITLIP